jgi:hypothetical protein
MEDIPSTFIIVLFQLIHQLNVPGRMLIRTVFLVLICGPHDQNSSLSCSYSPYVILILGLHPKIKSIEVRITAKNSVVNLVGILSIGAHLLARRNFQRNSSQFRPLKNRRIYTDTCQMLDNNRIQRNGYLNIMLRPERCNLLYPAVLCVLKGFCCSYILKLNKSDTGIVRPWHSSEKAVGIRPPF